MADPSHIPPLDNFVMNQVHTRPVITMESTACGATLLFTILEYYIKWVSLEELGVACGVSCDDSNARDIVLATRNYELDAKGYRLELEGLRKFEAPFIVFCQFKHFPVVEGLDRQWAYINDPEMCRRMISLKEFHEGFTGVALDFGRHLSLSG